MEVHAVVTVVVEKNVAEAAEVDKIVGAAEVVRERELLRMALRRPLGSKRNTNSEVVAVSLCSGAATRTLLASEHNAHWSEAALISQSDFL